MGDLNHPLARARGHGSAKTGVRHWVAQRVSALILLILIPWALYGLLSLAGRPHNEVVAFMAQPLNSALAILFVLSLTYHAMLGLQVVIEDYVHHAAVEITLLVAESIASGVAAMLGVLHFLQPVRGPVLGS